MWAPACASASAAWRYAGPPGWDRRRAIRTRTAGRRARTRPPASCGAVMPRGAPQHGAIVREEDAVGVHAAQPHERLGAGTGGGLVLVDAGERARILRRLADE